MGERKLTRKVMKELGIKKIEIDKSIMGSPILYLTYTNKTKELYSYSKIV
jgi:hypothetical protein